ncbi:MAG: carboxypeptidase regulatory-like domain-containing protein [Bacteroidetes bacterium]|nr:carboxypeptidase regulatory-like domain-containing protein [Bacteroidota bacterium]
MRHTLHLTIPTPCHERWDAMTATERGAFCHSCSKEVIDFSAMTDSEVIHWLEKHKTGCGRFRKEQLDRDMSLPKANTNLLRWKVLLMGLWPTLSLTPLTAHAALPPLTDQSPVKSKADTAIAKADTTVTACDTTHTGICGRVLDENGEGLIGAVVQVIDSNGKSTGQGAAVDLDGNYTIELQPGTFNLKVTAIGYETGRLIDIRVGHPYIVFKMQLEPVRLGGAVVILESHRTPAQKIKYWFRHGYYVLTHLRKYRKYKLAQQRAKD